MARRSDQQPSLFIAGSNDAVITGLIGGKRATELERVLPNLQQKLIIEGAGHWIQQERADEVNAALIAFLRRAVQGCGWPIKPAPASNSLGPRELTGA